MKKLNNEEIVEIQIIEDNIDSVNYLQSIFQESAHFQITDVFPSYEIAKNSFEKFCPFWIIDIGLPGKSGINALKEIKSLHPNSKVCMFTSIEDPVNILKCIKIGANGYLLKDISPKLFIHELESILLGGSPLTARVAEKILEEYISQNDVLEPEPIKNETERKSILTNRQIEILNYISLGMTYSSIANKLNKSPRTIRKHIENIYKNLKVNSKLEAIQLGIKIGILKRE
ncbi:response regulator transcription factor [Leptospira sp. GIMC2001]|uniref:response regulator transcription factor n=1 Tax=Leptospira sp. GIMC2001 TaxID=1513297 RepID=UPI00234B29D7|nr:response regulator transcription factor [Leptospira sp. GIMC2001]WCL49370.1 response regulator transcription factor [Leptospira sp. GIMC2001]